MKRVLIFGVSGFVGGHLTQEFVNHGYEVIGTDKIQNEKIPDLTNYYNVDLLDTKDVEKLILKINPDIIVNLAAVSSVGASWQLPQTTITVNVVGALNIMEAARKTTNHPRILLIGSSEEYIVSNYPMNEETPLNATNPYGISKVAQEEFANIYREQYGLKVYYVRSFNHTGVGQRESFVLPSWCKQISDIEKAGRSGTMRVGNLSVKRDFSHVKDVVCAYRMIVENEDCDTIYNVGSGITYSLDNLLDYIIGLSKQDIKIEIDPERFRPTEQQVICCDNSLIQSRLGWRPQFTVFDALKEMYDNFMNS